MAGDNCRPGFRISHPREFNVATLLADFDESGRFKPSLDFSEG
jgi:hypothetical protein